MSRLIVMTSAVFFSLSTAVLAADDKTTRQLDAHEHGHSTLNVGIEGKTVSMELEAPGADIVGFEYVAETEADKAKVTAAKKSLADPLSLFQPTAAAGCTLVSSNIDLVGGGKERHDAHGEDDHDDAHKKEAKHDDHADHGDEAKHDDHDSHDEAKEGGHNAFHATYALTCTNPGALKDFSFTFFETFKGAEELEVNVVSEKGQRRFEVERDAPKISLDSLT